MCVIPCGGPRLLGKVAFKCGGAVTVNTTYIAVLSYLAVLSIRSPARALVRHAKCSSEAGF